MTDSPFTGRTRPEIPQDRFDRAADAILARSKPKPFTLDEPISITNAYDPDPPAFAIDFETTIGRIVRQIRDAEESSARAILKAAYDAGYDDAANSAGRCCGCSCNDGEDFEGFLKRLLEAANA